MNRIKGKGKMELAKKLLMFCIYLFFFFFSFFCGFAVLVDVEYDPLILKEQKTELVGLKFIDSLFIKMENLNELNVFVILTFFLHELMCFNLYDEKGISILFVVWISFLILQVLKVSLQVCII